MTAVPLNAAKYRAIGVAVGLVSGLVLFGALFLGKDTRFDEAAFGEGESRFASVDGVRVHCRNVTDAPQCLVPEAMSKFDQRVLWLGNSQLHAINQRRPQDQTAPEILHHMLRAQKRYLVTFSEPNANLQEHLALFAYLYPQLKPRTLVLPVVFDDLREDGIRPDIAGALRDKNTQEVLAGFSIGKALVNSNSSAANSTDDLAGITDTVQERTERALTTWLSENSALWKARPEARGQIHLAMYRARNTILGIKPASVRRIIPGRFAANWDALRAIVALSERYEVRTVLYIVPLRTDIDTPYDAVQYEGFKKQLIKEFGAKAHVTVADLERTVSNQHWGTKAATSLGEDEEYDFMHFRGPGHEALAAALFPLVSTKAVRPSGL